VRLLNGTPQIRNELLQTTTNALMSQAGVWTTRFKRPDLSVENADREMTILKREIEKKHKLLVDRADLTDPTMKDLVNGCTTAIDELQKLSNCAGMLKGIAASGVKTTNKQYVTAVPTCDEVKRLYPVATPLFHAIDEIHRKGQAIIVFEGNQSMRAAMEHAPYGALADIIRRRVELDENPQQFTTATAYQCHKHLTSVRISSANLSTKNRKWAVGRAVARTGGRTGEWAGERGGGRVGVCERSCGAHLMPLRGYLGPF